MTSNPFMNPQAFFVTGYYSSFNGNIYVADPQLSEKPVKVREGFLNAVQGSASFKKALEESLRRIVHRDNPFTKANSIHDELKKRVYVLDAAPRMMTLPEDRLAMIESLNGKNPAFFRALSDQLFQQLGAGWYSSDFQYQVHMGASNGYVSKDALKEKLPQAYAAIVGEDGPVFIHDVSNRKHSVRCSLRNGELYMAVKDKKLAQDIFFNALKPQDLQAVVALLDGPLAQSRSADIIRENFLSFAPSCDGISYTDMGIAEKVYTYPATAVAWDFAAANARFIGTVEDLLRQSHIQWPQEKKQTLRSFFAKADSLLTSRGRKMHAEEKLFNREMNSVHQKFTL